MTRFKMLLRTFHSLSGAGLALIFIVMGLSGAALVFSHEIERAAHPAIGESQVDIYQSIDRIEALYGDRLTAIRTPAPDFPVFEVSLADKGPALMSGEAEIIASLAPFDALTATLAELHFRWFAGKAGNYANGLFAILLALFAASGLLLWTKRGFRWRAFAPKRFDPPALHSLHRNLGVLVAPFLLITAVTAAGVVFAPQVSKLLDRLAGPPPSEAPPLAGGGPVASLSEAMRIAKTVYPDAQFVQVFPADQAGVIRIWMKHPSEIAGKGFTRVSIASGDGSVLARSDGRAGRWSDKLMMSLLPLHSGHTGWPGHKLFAAFIGLSLAMLAAAGFSSFWMRRLRARK